MPVRAFGAPQTTCTGAPLAGVDHADAQTIGVRMRLRLDHPRDGEIFQLRGGIVHMLDLKADARQRLDDLARARPTVSRWSLSQERVSFIC